MNLETRLRLIVMASGLSRRFGSNKLLRHVNGRPMFQHILTLLRDFQSQRQDTTDVVVVSAWEILRASKLILWDKNDHNERGISESIKLGLGSRDLSQLKSRPFLRLINLFFQLNL